MILPLLLAALAAGASPVGTWRNPGDSVRIKVAACGRGALCGTVVSASATAKADAARGGTPRLIGTPLFREFRRGPDGIWQGSVFVPDLDTVVDGTLRLDGADALVAEGCLLPGIACRAQRWVRVARR